MHSEDDTAWNSSNGGATGLVTPSTALLNRKLATWKGPLMLKPPEVDLLGRSKKEMAEAIRAMVAIEAERQSNGRQAAFGLSRQDTSLRASLSFGIPLLDGRDLRLRQQSRTSSTLRSSGLESPILLRRPAIPEGGSEAAPLIS